ncbi:MAG: hypothetical protein JWR33_1201 [Naasia sp.]|uniref:hypothetical protein n=1 Tax=Naasia sp. TaxID=2546198 RepID=UPI0026187714|nr:hypothetical protein [Naasia sp.]MCU1570460.1 hypothetical protein [Naasia sp.]
MIDSLSLIQAIFTLLALVAATLVVFYVTALLVGALALSVVVTVTRTIAVRMIARRRLVRLLQDLARFEAGGVRRRRAA